MALEQPAQERGDAVPRNAPCPCGGGARYKDCHGSVKAAPVPSLAVAALADARKHLAAADPAAAEAACREALALAPDHPDALRLLAHCRQESGDLAEGLRLALAAARSLAAQPQLPAVEYEVWSDLNFMFAQALTGLDVTLASARRAEYASALSSPVDAPVDGRVSVVIVLPGHIHDVLATVACVLRQTWRDVELIVAYAAGDPRHDAAFAALADGSPFPLRWVAAPGASAALLADAGARAAAGDFVNVLLPGDEFPAGRLETMLRALAGGAEWGFSNVAFLDAGDEPVAPEADARVASWARRLASIPEVETVGHAFVHQEFVAVGVGNLFFRRALHGRVGGFRDLPYTWSWDFCLRALWLVEPVYVPAIGFHRRIAETTAGAWRPDEAFAAAQVAMFADYYTRACRDDCVPPNAFAPSVARWRMQFLKSVFQTGHVLALPLGELERVGAAVIARLAARRAPAAAPGINLVGFAYGEFGLSESLRALGKACLAGQIPFGIKDVDQRINQRQADRSMAGHVVDEIRHSCTVLCLNPDLMKPMRSVLRPDLRRARYNIGYWFWELAQFPDEWTYAIADVDEIWVSSRFIADAVRRETSKPVVLIPHAIGVTPSRRYVRAEFGLPDDRFLFLFSFDFNSFPARKNPEGVVAAFREAFPAARRDVGLVIKSINAATRPAKMQELRQRIGGDERVRIVDAVFTRDQVSGLQTVVDAFVSLHRSEGFGLGLAESMYHGKPVIGTGYSGNLEFMNEDNSCLVDYRMVPLRPGDYLYDDMRFEWAEPDVAHAAQQMRQVADDGGFRRRIAARGRDDIRDRLTHAAAAAAMRARLRELGLV